jgi:hypothetical protein
MCKTIYLSLILLAAVTTANAQEKTRAEFGVHIGPSLSLMYNEHPRQNPRKPGRPVYNASAFGISGQYNFNRMVALRAEANFEHKGDVLFSSRTYSNATGGESFFTNSTGYNSIDYFTLPVTVKLSFGKRVQFFTNIGLYMGVNVRARQVITDATFNRGEPGKVTTVTSETDISRDTKRMDGGLVTGLGVAIPLWKTLSLTFEGRNHLGFVNVNNGSELFPGRVRNNSTAFLFGLSFGLNKPAALKDQEKKEKSKL